MTVFDSDTQVPLDTFELAVAGLTEYDIVQAKQTVRNVDDGLLPLLESMGIAAWSDLIYTNSAGGPYQLLGKAYFVPAGVLYDLDRWQLDAVTEDMALGVAAHERGCTLGIIDATCRTSVRPPSRPGSGRNAAGFAARTGTC